MAINFFNDIMKFLSGVFKKTHERDFGLQGGTYIGTFDVIYTGRWQAIKANGNAGDPALRFTLLTTAAGDDMTGFRLNPGDILYGDFTEIRIDSLGAYAYFKN
tara:strand:- start:116 stop:424 length:309 start_codon:yes stop_codon:yes gene_type:complete